MLLVRYLVAWTIGCMFASTFTSILLLALVLLASIMPITRMLSLRSRGRSDIGRLDNWMFGRLDARSDNFTRFGAACSYARSRRDTWSLGCLGASTLASIPLSFTSLLGRFDTWPWTLLARQDVRLCTLKQSSPSGVWLAPSGSCCSGRVANFCQSCTGSEQRSSTDNSR